MEGGYSSGRSGRCLGYRKVSLIISLKTVQKTFVSRTFPPISFPIFRKIAQPLKLELKLLLNRDQVGEQYEGNSVSMCAERELRFVEPKRVRMGGYSDLVQILIPPIRMSLIEPKGVCVVSVTFAMVSPAGSVSLCLYDPGDGRGS